MSVRVSCKKQFTFGLLLLVIALVVIEVVSNFWWFEINKCYFEKSEIFKNLDEEVKRQLCLESYDLQYTSTQILPQKGDDVIGTILGGERIEFEGLMTINSDGFRGEEISKYKPENIYRIFTVGGSTTFGAGVMNDQTFPVYLQKKFNESTIETKVEVINAAIGGINSIDETEMVKTRLVDYNPDLIIVYDGWNDISYQNSGGKGTDHISWKDRWVDTCEFAKQQDFEIIIILQPVLGTGNRILTDQEYQNYFNSNMKGQLEKYPLYAQQLPELSTHCIETADFREIFDNVNEAVYWDNNHVGPKGNQVIANNIFDLFVSETLRNKIVSSDEPDQNTIFIEKSNDMISDNDEKIIFDNYQILRNFFSEYKSPRVISYIFFNIVNQFNIQNFGGEQETKSNNSIISLNFQNADLSGKNFEGKNLTKAIFYGTDLSNTNFKNAYLKEADFRLANLNKTSFSGAILDGAKFSFVKFIDIDLSGKEFNNSILVGADFTQSNLKNFDLSGKDLSYTNFSKTDLSNKDLTDTVLFYSNLSEAILRGVDLMGKDLHNVNMLKTDLSGLNLSKTNLTNSDLFFANLSHSNLSYADLSGSRLDLANLEYADLSFANLSGVNLETAILNNTNFTNCFNHTICK